MATRPIFPGTPKNFGVTFTSADTTTAKDLVTAGSSGSIIDILNIISDDTAAKNLILQLYNGSTGYDLNEITIPIGAGTNGSALPVNGLDIAYTPALGNREDRAIYLQTGWKLRGRMKATMTAAKTITVAGCYGDF